MRRPTLVVMAKAPRSGRVKTRLGRDIGMPAAAWWARHHLARLLRRIADPRWRVVVALSPDNASLNLANCPNVGTISQGGGDLGQRMRRALIAPGQGPVVVIGSDIPGITGAHIRRALAALGNHDFAFGPATDGGFWMVGAARRRALPPRLFVGARWSTADALTDSLRTLNGQSHALTDRLADVDCAADLVQTARPRRDRPGA